MEYDIYTISREELAQFEDRLPGYVLERAGDNGFYLIGAIGSDDSLAGFLLFNVGQLPEGEVISSLVYVFVDEDCRGDGVGSSLLDAAHEIIGRSHINKCLVVFDKKHAKKRFFVENGYVFMKLEKGASDVAARSLGRPGAPGMEQGVFWIGR